MLPASAVAVDTTSATTKLDSLVVGLKKTSVKCIDKLNELYCERGIFTAAETGNVSGNLADNQSLTSILSDSKKRLAQASR